MRKPIVILLTLGLVAGAVMAGPAEAKKKKKKTRTERTIEGRYEFPSGVGAGGGVCLNCPAFPAAPGETWVKIEITDDNTPIAGVEFSPGDLDGDGIHEPGIYVCGATDGWVEIPEGSQMQSFPWILSQPTDCPGGSATSGTIKITYSSSPGK